MTREEFLEAVSTAPDAQARRFLFEGHTEHMQVETVYALKERADELERDDAGRALRIGQAAEQLAEVLSSDEARATALWTQANARDYLSELDTAVLCYERAVVLFNAAGKPLEAARATVSLMYPLLKMGQFDRVQALAETIHPVFVERGDIRSLAKVQMNVGILHTQQGRYAQALEDFCQATKSFESLGDRLYVAMNQINQANMMMLMDDFRGAEQLHLAARPVFDTADFRSVAASVDHDLAILQYSRGNYSEAFRTFERARDVFASLESSVNLAQTDLEESDVYLDLNLPDEALRLAQRAEQAFGKMEMAFELARARANHAVALARMGQIGKAILLLDDARSLFAGQENPTWVAHADLQRAELLGQLEKRIPAATLALEAAAAYDKLGMKTKRAYAHIVAANLYADDQDWDRTHDCLDKAREILDGLSAPWLEQRIETCFGRVHEGKGQPALAVAHYQRAVAQIEQMAAMLTGEEHRTAFVADKLAPYEGLVELNAAADPAAAFQWAEQAKSRALIDLLASGVRPRVRAGDAADADKVERLQVLRDELNWLYTRVTRGAAPGEAGAPAAGPDTWSKINACEREAVSLWRDLQVRYEEKLSVIRVAPLQPAEIQAQLPADTALVEYFIARHGIIAFVLTRGGIRSLKLSENLDDVLALTESLAFQFSKFQLGQPYIERHRDVLLGATQDVLARLGNLLLAPLMDELARVSSVIIVPHGLLHTVPFQALRIDDHYLIETHGVSYAPSAAVLKFCWNKPSPAVGARPFDGKPLLVGVPDERAPHVAEEVRALADLFGDVDCLVGPEATLEQFRRYAPSCGVLHVAAHGLFRSEAPLLSSVRLADHWLAAQDVYDLDLRASLVTLSACETGLGRDAGGDDLVGLVRGFLYAGAGSLLVSLWTVEDESMTQLVMDFYGGWLKGRPKAQALRDAQLNLLAAREHPYFWAPLVLVGNQN